jgi:hypothetical protein
LIKPTGELLGSEFRVNARTAGAQTHPSVATDGDGQALVVWSGFTGGASSMDVNAQIYNVPQLPALDAPVVTDLGVNKLIVSWQAPVGQDVSYYEVYLDGASLPSALVTNAVYWMLKGLVPGESHVFQVGYVASGGERSPLSEATTGATGVDANHDDIADAWQTLYWGTNRMNWPAATADSNGNGLSNYSKFIAGLNPLDAQSLLRVRLRNASGVYALEWSSVAGKLYQVQARNGLTQSWTNLGVPTVGASGVTAVNFSPGRLGFYRVMLVP